MRNSAVLKKLPGESIVELAWRKRHLSRIHHAKVAGEMRPRPGDVFGVDIDPRIDPRKPRPGGADAAPDFEDATGGTLRHMRADERLVAPDRRAAQELGEAVAPRRVLQIMEGAQQRSA